MIVIISLRQQRPFTEASNGLNETSLFSRADISSWPIYIAYWADSFGISPTTLAHSAFGVTLIIIWMCVTISLANKINKNEHQKFWFLLVYCLLAMWSVVNKSDIWGEFWIVKYPWYGVAVLNILLFCLLDSILYLYQEEDYIYKISYWIYNLIIILACVECEIVGLILAPIFCFVYGLPYLFRIGWKKVKKLLPYIGGVVAFVGVFAVMILYQIFSKGIRAGMLGIDPDITWGYWMQKFFQMTPLILLWILSFIYIIFGKNTINKCVFGKGCFVLWLIFLNPFFYNIISNYITSQVVYYRLFWCIPILYMIAYAISETVLTLNQNRKIIVVIGALLLYVWGTPQWSIFRDVEKATNQYKLDGNIIEVADYMLDNGMRSEIRVIAPEDLGHYLRQYSSNIIYPCSMRSSSEKIGDFEYTYYSFYQSIYTHELDRNPRFSEIIYYLDTDYIVYSEEEKIPIIFQDAEIAYVGGYQIVELRRDKLK